MRTPRALLHAMRTRRIHRIGPAEADRLVTGDHTGTSYAALNELLDAARGPATAEELQGEKAAVAAFTAHRRSAARTPRRPAKARAAVVTVATGLALLALGGTAVAARTGNLPQGAQQHAHRLFSALGVPAPRTGPPGPSPSPNSSAPAILALGWCDAWGRKGGPSGPHPSSLSGDDVRKLAAAAGGEGGIERYCADLRKSASASPAPSPSGSRSASPTPSGSAASVSPSEYAPGEKTPGATPSPSATPTAQATEAVPTDDATARPTEPKQKTASAPDPGEG
jgi:hypothetical protein